MSHNQPAERRRGLWALIDRVFNLETISGDGLCPVYLYRWTLLRAFVFRIYLHKFIAEDWSKDHHDHPWHCISIGLKGSYLEEVIKQQRWGTSLEFHHYRAPWVRYFPPTHRHRVSGPTPEKPCWTMVIVSRPRRAWGWWLDNHTWVHWRAYVGSDRAKQAKACQ